MGWVSSWGSLAPDLVHQAIMLYWLLGMLVKIFHSQEVKSDEFATWLRIKCISFKPIISFSLIALSQNSSCAQYYLSSSFVRRSLFLFFFSSGLLSYKKRFYLWILNTCIFTAASLVPLGSSCPSSCPWRLQISYVYWVIFGHLLINRTSMATLGPGSPSKGIISYKRTSSKAKDQRCWNTEKLDRRELLIWKPRFQISNRAEWASQQIISLENDDKVRQHCQQQLFPVPGNWPQANIKLRNVVLHEELLYFGKKSGGL